MLYACDGKWWHHKAPPPDRFAGLRVTQDHHAAKKQGLNAVLCKTTTHHLLFDRFGIIGNGSNGGFQALNLAVQFGARRIVLIGFDMTLRAGVHWHGKHPAPLNNPRQASVDFWRMTLDSQAGVLRELGIEVMIGAPGSALQNFETVEFWKAIGMKRPKEAP